MLVCFQYSDHQNKPDYKLSRYFLPRFSLTDARTVSDNQKHLCADWFRNPLFIVSYRGIDKAKRKAPVKKENLNQNKKQQIVPNFGTSVVSTTRILDSKQTRTTKSNEASNESNNGATDRAHDQEDSKEARKFADTNPQALNLPSWHQKLRNSSNSTQMIQR